MRWPWSKREPEQRSTAQGYTASLTAALQAGAEGGVSDTAPLATAALEAAAGLYGRCMAAAVVKDAPDVADALAPPVLALIARNLIRRGEDHHRIYVRGGRLVLEPVGFAYAHGNGPDPMAVDVTTRPCTVLYGLPARMGTGRVDAALPVQRRCVAAVAWCPALVMGGEHVPGHRGVGSVRRTRGERPARQLARDAGVATG